MTTKHNKAFLIINTGFYYALIYCAISHHKSRFNGLLFYLLLLSPYYLHNAQSLNLWKHVILQARRFIFWLPGLKCVCKAWFSLATLTQEPLCHCENRIDTKINTSVRIQIFPLYLCLCFTNKKEIT